MWDGEGGGRVNGTGKGLGQKAKRYCTTALPAHFLPLANFS